MKLMLAMAIAVFSLNAVFAQGTNGVMAVRTALDGLDSFCSSNGWDDAVMYEALNFECLRVKPEYGSFAVVVSNSWRDVMSNFATSATNTLERLLVLGVGKNYDEDFYMDYLSSVADLRTNGVITARELLWTRASTRRDLMSCFIRRYQEPRVRTIVDKMILAEPQHSNYWCRILSGSAYTNYLEEVEAGLWE